MKAIFNSILKSAIQKAQRTNIQQYVRITAASEVRWGPVYLLNQPDCRTASLGLLLINPDGSTFWEKGKDEYGWLLESPDSEFTRGGVQPMKAQFDVALKRAIRDVQQTNIQHFVRIMAGNRIHWGPDRLLIDQPARRAESLGLLIINRDGYMFWEKGEDEYGWLLESSDLPAGAPPFAEELWWQKKDREAKELRHAIVALHNDIRNFTTTSGRGGSDDH